MIEEQFDIVKAFSVGVDIELTINQISKAINKSYAFTNKYTHELIEQNVLLKKAIGSAIVCSLNFSSEEALGCLVMASIKSKKRYLESAEGKKTLTRIDRIQRSYSDIIYAENGALTAVSSANQPQNSKDFLVITADSFKKKVKQLDLSKIVVLEGHESFWKLVAEVIV